MWSVTTSAGRGFPVHPFIEKGEAKMRAETEIRVRLSRPLKAAWKARARDDGISLSHAIRTAGRLGMLLGPARIQETVATVSAMRRDLHSLDASLQMIASGGPGIDPSEVRAVVARVHEAADAATNFLRRR